MYMYDNGRFHTYLAMFTDIGHEYRISSVMKCLVLFAACHLYVIHVSLVCYSVHISAGK